MKYKGKTGIKYEVLFCATCNTDSISCERCDNSSCNGNSCNVCDEDFNKFNGELVGKYLGGNK